MSASQREEASKNGAKEQHQAGAENESDVPCSSMHHCDSWTSFRTATPDSTFGHPLQLAPRAMTGDPTAGLKNCPSSASIRTMSPEVGFGHQLRRVAKHHEEAKGETAAAGAKGEEKADKTPHHNGTEEEAKK